MGVTLWSEKTDLTVPACGKCCKPKSECTCKLRKEKELLDDITKIHHKYCKLPPTHPRDGEEWERAIHDLQKLIGMRMLRELRPEIFPKKNEKGEKYE